MEIIVISATDLYSGRIKKAVGKDALPASSNTLLSLFVFSKYQSEVFFIIHIP